MHFLSAELQLQSFSIRLAVVGAGRGKMGALFTSVLVE